MPSSSDTAIRLLLRRALTSFPTPQVRAVTVDFSAPTEPLAYHVTVHHHGPAAPDLMDRLKAAHAAVLTRFAAGSVPKARLTLRRCDRPKAVVSVGAPLFVQPGTVVSTPPATPLPQPAATRSPDRSLNDVDPLSPAQLRRHHLTRAAANARQKPINRLSPSEILTLLHDGRGVRHLLPAAVKAASADPWGDRGHHPGDLLMAVLQTPAGVCAPGTALHKQLRSLANAALKAAAKRSPALRQLDLENEIRRLVKRWPS